MKIGLKLYSTDVALIPYARELKAKDFFDFVELYVIPGSYESTIGNWKSFDVPYIIHAPHSYHGINLAQADKWETNLQNFNEARSFASELNSEFIIVHGGNDGSFDETIRQIGQLKEYRIVLENKPKIGMFNEVCVGWSPSEFRRAIEAGILYGTVLDFGHATCAAKSLDIDVAELVRELMEFNPKIFHLSDGYVSSEKDNHLNLGKGDFNIKNFISVIPNNSLVTIETPRSPLKNLDDFVEDVCFLKKLLLQKDKCL